MIKTRGFTYSDNDHNEDTYYVCDKFGFVIDGATGLKGKKVTDYKTDAQWFSNKFSDYLKQALLNEEKSLTQILKEGIAEIDNKFNNFAGAEEIEIKPSASIAIFRIVNDYLEYLVLGDCPIILNTKKVKVITIKDLQKFDKNSLKHAKKYAKKHKINVSDSIPFINDVLISVRNKRNTPNGYWTLADNPKAIDHALYERVKKEDVKQVVLVSDGFAQIYDLFKYFNPKNLLKELDKCEIKDVFEILYKLQEDDKFCNKYPRFKLRDDTTLIEWKIV